MWNCAICGFTFFLFFVLLSHYRSRHANDTLFTIRRNLYGCEKKYTNVKSFVRHASGIHIVFSNCHRPSETGGELTFTMNAALHVEDDSGMS